MTIPMLPLSDGQSIALLGFGTGTTWYKEGGEGPLDIKLIEILETAIASGFTHIDCADAYGTQEEVGIAVKESGIPRDKLFITTKVLDNVADIPSATDASLRKLQIDYVDLYLIHTPYYTKEEAELQRAWKTIEGVKGSGKAKSIGIANFQRPHVEAILKVASVVPAVNQIEFHPYLQRDHDYIPWMKERGIEVPAYKALAPLTVDQGGPLVKPLVMIAQKHGVSVDAVLLKWQMNQNVIPITTTGSKERISEYLQAISLVLTPEEQEEITQVGLKYHFRWWGNQFFEPQDRS